MDTKRICSICGKTLAANAPEGLCPECLLKAGMGSGVNLGPETETGGRPRFVPPTVAELTPRFPQLEILELIGQGGMGAVYRARQKELDRIVALKILPPDIGEDAAFAERFTREARALARLNHPGIVTIHDFGRANGLFYFLMEFVDGVTLQQLLQGGRLSPREALAIVPQICDALQFAHDQGIVHRDIKPENVLMDRRGRVKVADFGLAKLVGGGNEPAANREPAAGPAALTGSGNVLGTPDYMAPEQMEHPEAVDHRADIYALGVVFYQMLTGELPGRRIEAPSKRVQVDVRLDEVVLRALEKEPRRRYQQASLVKADVETIATASPGEGGAHVGTGFASDTPREHPIYGARGPTQRIPGMLPLFSLAAALTFAGTLFCGVLCELLLGHVLGRWLIGFFLLLACGSATLAFVVGHKASPHTRKRCFQAAAWLAVAAALPVAGFALFFLNALIMERGGWHPATAEAVIVPLTWFGSILLPCCAWWLWRATIQPSNSAASRSPGSQADANGVNWKAAAVILLAVAAAGLSVWWSQREVSHPAGTGYLPEREITLNDCDVQPEALDFETGRVLALSEDAMKQLENGDDRWFLTTRADLLMDTTSKGVGLITSRANELTLLRLADTDWQSMRPRELSKALSRPVSGLAEDQARHIGKVYFFPGTTPAPVTMGFRTGGGAEGLLQLIRYGGAGQPPLVLRYKLVQVSNPTKLRSAPDSSKLPAVTARPGEYKVTLTNGVSFEVVGILRNPRGTNRWWKPDGNPFPTPPAEVVKLPELEPTTEPQITIVPADEFLIYDRWTLPEKIEEQIGRMVWQKQVEFLARPVWSEVPATVRDPDTGKQSSADLVWFSDPPKSVNCRVAVAVGPWEPVAVYDGSDTKELVSGVMAVCSPPTYDERTRAYRFEVMHNLDREAYALRLVARLKNGTKKEVVFHSGFRTGNPAKGFSLIHPDDFEPGDVREYVLERTPWVRGEIKDIALASTAPH